MKIFLGADHAGYEMKEKVKSFLMRGGYEVVDCGADMFDKNDDYPDFIGKAARGVSQEGDAMGIIFGGSGQGEAIVANKFANVRCTVFYAPAYASSAVDVSGKEGKDKYEMLRLCREHNNANMLSLGSRFLKPHEALQAVEVFLEAKFLSEERHLRRIKKIGIIEKELIKI